MTVGNGSKFVDYGASYLRDPLNELLDAVCLALKRPGKYFYVMHVLEPDSVVWLLKFDKGKLILILWESTPEDFELLEELEFDSGDLLLFDEPFNLTTNLVFAVKDSPIPFITELISVFPKLATLEKREEDDDWGFDFNEKRVNELKQWLSNNSS